MTDIEIENSVIKKDINYIADELNIDNQDIELYGKYKAKVKLKPATNKSKLILVTAINPTPYGEGKTTVSIGLNDGFHKLNKRSIAVLREPSLGPVFGLKGGATGGGYSQIIPSADINLHFTGDLHAITSANNLLCAAIDNHIFNGNKLEIDEVLFNRCLDINDRSLRNVKIKNKEASFNITAASEIMSIFCLSKNINELKENLGNIIIGKRKDDSFIYAKELKIEDSLVVLLKEAFYPNLVQSLENNPVLVHGGPFANISVGCSSINSINLGLSLSDYVITEAGFGADLGAEKFFDIVCRKLDKKVDCVVLVATIRALKYYGNGNLEKGCSNLSMHIENLKENNTNIVVALNKFEDDLKSDLDYIESICKEYKVPFSMVTSYAEGSSGSIQLASKVIETLETDNDFNYLYEIQETFDEKFKAISQKIYRANNIIYSDLAMKKLKEIKKNKLSLLPVCIAKTQYSISDDKNRLIIDSDYSLQVKDIKIYNGAGFITVLLGDILTMPGLSKKPNYEKIKLNDEESIIGIK